VAKTSTGLYLSDGKQDFRDLLLRLAQHDGLHTYGTFWGGGIDSRMFAAAGFDVIAAEIVQDLHAAMDADAAEHGYRTWHKDAARMPERCEMFHADFMGNASGHAFRTLRRIAANTEKWLAVTLSPDHQINQSMQGESALYTVPAWLVGASGFTLEYFGRYVRNAGGQVMFVALLEGKPSSRGQRREVHPLQLVRGVTGRGYWARHDLHDRFPDLLPHRKPYYTTRERDRLRERYASDPEYREKMRAASKSSYEANKAAHMAQSAKWAKEHPDRRRDIQRKSQLRRRLAAVSGTAAEAVNG
jgi:hypothetical protein